MGDTVQKQQFRKYMLQLRASYSEEERKVLSEKASKLFLQMPFYQQSKKIALFASFRQEMDTWAIIDASLRDRKSVYLPRIHKKRMYFFPVLSISDLTMNSMGIMEPPFQKDDYARQDLDLILVPGLAFGTDGSRLGYGGGYYDRFLKTQSRALKLGFGFFFQKFDSVPACDYDYGVDAFLSDEGLQIFNTSSIMFR